jgi:uncharacterized protein YfkK (UPF0435 family)
MQDAIEEVYEIMFSKPTKLLPGNFQLMRKSVIQLLIAEYNNEYTTYLRDSIDIVTHKDNIVYSYNLLMNKEEYSRTHIVNMAHEIMVILYDNPSEEDLQQIYKIIEKCTAESSVCNHLIIALMLTTNPPIPLTIY